VARIRIDGGARFLERRDWLDDPVLLRAAAECIAAQREAAAAARAAFMPNPDAETDVSPEALRKILDSGGDVHGIASDDGISNVIVFNAKHLRGAIESEAVAVLRSKVDQIVGDKLRDTFEDADALSITCSGHFWYPPGGYMAWHTNSGAPGWRVYLTHVAEPGRSFFRYREPSDGRVVTLIDDAWDVRLFRVDATVPFWHAICSQTDRFSLGYTIRPRRPLRGLAKKIRKALGAS
jgi:hypothetical protein